MDAAAFVSIAKYLNDPLVLAGFVVFVAFLALRQLLTSGIVGPLRHRESYNILRLVFSYGFVLGFAIIILGIGLKYRELSKEDQRSALKVIVAELKSNQQTIGELAKNVGSLFYVAEGLSNVIRDPRFKILSGLFSAKNIDPSVEEATLTNLYIERSDWLQASGLLDDVSEIRRAAEACAAIVRFIDRVYSTVESLRDKNRSRYIIYRRAWDENLAIAHKIHIADVGPLADLYTRMEEIRTLYDRIGAIVAEYSGNVRVACKNLPPSREELGPALAIERLTFRMLPGYRNRLVSISDKIDRAWRSLESQAR